MFVIVKHGGKQYWAESESTLLLETVEQDVGETVELEVIAKGDAKNVTACEEKINAEIVKHFRDKKVIIFKKNKRHHYSRKKGHRQHLTQVKIATFQ